MPELGRHDRALAAYDHIPAWCRTIRAQQPWRTPISRLARFDRARRLQPRAAAQTRFPKAVPDRAFAYYQHRELRRRLATRTRADAQPENAAVLYLSGLPGQIRSTPPPGRHRRRRRWNAQMPTSSPRKACAVFDPPLEGGPNFEANLGEGSGTAP